MNANGTPAAAGAALSSGWTGGQYSAFRVVLGAYLTIHFVRLVPWATELFSSRGVVPHAELSPLSAAFPSVLTWFDAPPIAVGLAALGAFAGVLLAVGALDRAAAVVAWYVLACFTVRNPLILNPSLPFVGWMLLAHALLPRAPYGSWAARGRLDPSGGWRFTPGIARAAWIVMSVAYSYSGYTKLISPSWVDGTALARVLENPLARPTWVREAMLALPDVALSLATWGTLALELAFAPLALFRRVRPWLWWSMLAMHVGLIVVIDFAELSFGMILLHAFTFDPRWLPARSSAPRDDVPVRVYYDGDCGLCHGFVRFVLAEDGAGAIRFAPLQGETFDGRVPAGTRETLPDSVVVDDGPGPLRVRSDGVFAVLRAIGGLWRLVALVGGVVPRPIRDGVYDAIAAVRRRVFSKPDGQCPLLPPGLTARFDP